MASRLSQRLWVGMMLVMVVELSETVQKCIFDEVQARVRVVRAAPIIQLDSPTNESRLTALNSEPLSGFLATKRGSMEGRAPPTPTLPQPIRIQTWITRESDNLSGAEKIKLEASVKEALRIMSSILSVNRAPGPLRLSRDVDKYCKFLWRNTSTANYNRCGRVNKGYRSETCLDVTIPDDHLAGCDIYPEADSPRRIILRSDGAGLADTDFLLYLHMKSTDKCRGKARVVAYAVHCRTDADGRPLAGVVVICRHRLSEDAYNHNMTVQLLIHELVHVLGFSKHLFHTWRDCPSSSRGGNACSPRKKVTHSDGSGEMRIYTQSVTSAMQEHLASDDPELGGPLENRDVPPGGVSSHWEARVLQGSIMTAALEDWTTVRIDPVTLAALQDTGWYQVNLSQAQSLVWGKGEGATFGSLSTCKDNSFFFCSGSGRGCHFLHFHKGECQTDPYLEGCQMYKPLHNGSECWNKGTDPQSAEQNWNGEIYGSDSRCFFSNLTRQNESHPRVFSRSVEGRCYRHRCTGLNRYQIRVSDSEWLDCPAGNAIKIRAYRGLVFCPDRRLCLFPDSTPPSDNTGTFPAFNFSDPLGSALAQDGTLRPPEEITVATALCLTAAVCLLAAVVACYRKCRTRGVRIHSGPEDDTTDRV